MNGWSDEWAAVVVRLVVAKVAANEWQQREAARGCCQSCCHPTRTDGQNIPGLDTQTPTSSVDAMVKITIKCQSFISAR